MTYNLLSEVQAIRLSMLESEHAGGKPESVESAAAPIEPPLPPPPGLSKAPSSISSYGQSQQEVPLSQAVAAPVSAGAAAAAPVCSLGGSRIQSTEWVLPDLGDMDLNIVDDDVLLSYALSLSEMQEPTAHAHTHTPTHTPGAARYGDDTVDSSGAGGGGSVDMFSEASDTGEQVLDGGFVNGDNDILADPILGCDFPSGHTEIEEDASLSTPPACDLVHSAANSDSPCSPPRQLPKRSGASSSLRLLEMIDAALNSPVGQFTGTLSLSDEDNDEDGEVDEEGQGTSHIEGASVMSAVELHETVCVSSDDVMLKQRTDVNIAEGDRGRQGDVR